MLDRVKLWWLTSRLKSKDEGVRATAAYELGQAQHLGAVPALIKTIEDASPGVREASLEALSNIGDPRAVQPIIESLKDSSFYVRKKCAKALKHVRDTKAIQPLVNAFNDCSDLEPWQQKQFREAVIETLAEYRGATIANRDVRAVQTMVAMTTIQEYMSPFEIPRALKLIGDAQELERVLRAYPDEQGRFPFVLGEVIHELLPSWTRTDHGRQVVLKLGSSLNQKGNSEWNRNVMSCLGGLGDASALESLVTFYDAGYGSEGPELGHQLEESLQAIKLILEKDAKNCSVEALHRAAKLPNRSYWSFSTERDDYDGTYQARVSKEIDCDWARHLARRELVRRGLEV